jgi:hypothetical protein
MNENHAPNSGLFFVLRIDFPKEAHMLGASELYRLPSRNDEIMGVCLGISVPKTPNKLRKYIYQANMSH